MPDPKEHLAHRERSQEVAPRVPARGAAKVCRSLCSCVAAMVLSLTAPAPSGSVAAAEPLRVVTTTTDLKSLAEAVGGTQIAVNSIVPPGADAEEYQPKPQDVGRLGSARLVVRVGLDFDLWLDKLVARSGRADLGRGQPAHIDASLAITLLDVYAQGVGPGDGHAHGSGNPHYWLDPRNAEVVTAVILERLADLDPGNARVYEANRLRFLEMLDGKIAEWEQKLRPLQGRPLVAYHTTWSYLARRFRLNIVATIEQRPGVPATPAHLNSLIGTMRQKDVRVILRAAGEGEQGVALLVAKTGAKLAVLAGSVGAAPQAGDYIALFDWNVAQLSAAFDNR